MIDGLLMNRIFRMENMRKADAGQRIMRTVIVYGSQYGTAKDRSRRDTECSF